jgi:hypothetical protein
LHGTITGIAVTDGAFRSVTAVAGIDGDVIPVVVQVIAESADISVVTGDGTVSDEA